LIPKQHPNHRQSQYLTKNDFPSDKRKETLETDPINRIDKTIKGSRMVSPSIKTEAPQTNITPLGKQNLRPGKQK
jgi:hypothetical protein